MKPIANAQVHSTNTNYRHDIETDGHTLVADEPVEHGGSNAGPVPYELFLSGLGACTAITLRMYVEKKAWDLGNFRSAWPYSRITKAKPVLNVFYIAAPRSATNNGKNYSPSPIRRR